MKKNYKSLSLAISLVVLSPLAIAQCVTPSTPTISSSGACGSGFPLSATLSATGASTLQTGWYANAFGGNAVGTGSTYATPSLTAPTVYYAAQLDATGTASLSLPSQSSTFSGNSRGYWFTAPTSFVITGVRVPTDASTGNSNIAIVKFQGAVPPPLFSATTNSFDVLYLTQSNSVAATGTISVNIPVYAGDVIGVLGDRAGINSYAPAPSNQTLGTFSVTLTRLGMQFPLATNVPQQLWMEAAGSISRVELYTTLGCLNSLTAYTVDALPSPTVNVSVSNSVVCAGSPSTLTASGANTYSWNTSATTASVSVSPTTTSVYTVVGTGTNNCTDTKTISVNVNPLPAIAFTPTAPAICIGGSVVISANGASTYSWNTSATTSSISVNPTVTTIYTVIGTSTANCTRTSTVNLTVNALPTVAVTAPSSLVCVGSTTLNLTGSPNGGVYSGSNVTGNVFTPGTTPGTFSAVYAYTNSTTGCSNTNSTSIVVSACTGFNESAATTTADNVLVYPNPANNYITIELSANEATQIELFDVIGRRVISKNAESKLTELDLSALVNGVYYLKVASGNQTSTLKVVKQ
jgi:hypothetical protein